MSLEFDQSTHTYKLDGVKIPSVTEILNELVPIQYKAGDWYLQRGRAVHACAAMIARGELFNYDDRIAGQVKAIQKFFDEVKPEILQVEHKVYSKTYRYAGTNDLLCKIGYFKVLVDYKGAVDIIRTSLQLAGYSIGTDIQYGIGIEIKENGSYIMTHKIKLKAWERVFLALRTTYQIREELGLNKKEEGI